MATFNLKKRKNVETSLRDISRLQKTVECLIVFLLISSIHILKRLFITILIIVDSTITLKVKEISERATDCTIFLFSTNIR
jgi:hypothetical protein